jgi:aminoacrylate hydrolase
LWLYPPDYVNEHDAEIDEERRRAVGSAPPVEVSVGRIDALLKFDRRADLGRIRAPTLIIASTNDYITPSYYARALAQAIPGSKLEIVEGGGHSISKTRPDFFNERVLQFLSGS